MSIKPFVYGCSLVLILSLASLPGWAASIGSSVSSTSASTSKSADFTAGEKAAMDGNFEAAIGYFTKVVNTDPTNADGFNLLGYSHRKVGNVELAFENYNEALALKSDHLGANEYIGELYLEIGDLANAEKHLKVLDAACFFGCAAYSDLKSAIKKYKTKQGG